MNIEEEIISNLGREIQKEIDFEVLAGMLKELGWTKVVLSPMTKEHSDIIDKWVIEYVKGPHETLGLVWMFQDSADAINFTLRWC